MRVVLQRVLRAAVRVRGELVAEIGPGLLLLVASGANDRSGDADKLAAKIFGLRIFEDLAGKMNMALADTGSPDVLVVPQFTLYGDVRHGRRPSWAAAAGPQIAAERIEAFAAALERLGAKVARGAFQEHMEVELVNDGPVTLSIDADDLPG
jgi:D-tyrosyl-tRNA(Tyr) deacylase